MTSFFAEPFIFHTLRLVFQTMCCEHSCTTKTCVAAAWACWSRWILALIRLFRQYAIFDHIFTYLCFADLLWRLQSATDVLHVTSRTRLRRSIRSTAPLCSDQTAEIGQGLKISPDALHKHIERRNPSAMTTLVPDIAGLTLSHDRCDRSLALLSKSILSETAHDKVSEHGKQNQKNN
jgi:hypothetical protein